MWLRRWPPPSHAEVSDVGEPSGLALDYYVCVYGREGGGVICRVVMMQIARGSSSRGTTLSVTYNW